MMSTGARIAAVLACLAAACSESMGVPPGPGSGGTGGAVQTGGAAGTGGVVQTGGAAGAGGVQTDGAAGNAAVDAGPDRADAAADVDAGADRQTDAADSADAADSSDAADAPVGTCPAGVSGHCSSATCPTYAGFTLKLVEDFDTALDLATDPNWTYSDGFGDSRYTRYVKEAITFAGGNAVITATNDGVLNTGYPTFADGQLNAFPGVATGTTTVKSGELRTKYQNWRYGRFEVRMKTPKNSNVIARFQTFRTPSWQEWRDLMFDITPANAANSAGTNICKGQGGNTYGLDCAYHAYPVPSLVGGATIYDDFHTYAFENTPTKVTWYADGDLIRTETTRLPDMSMKIILNLWVFPSGGWGGSGGPGANTYPMSMQIDWVRLYKLDTDDTYPCSPLPSCQPAGDRDYQKNNAEDGLPSAAPW